MESTKYSAKPKLYIGIMSGTSVDGIDVVLTKINDNNSQFIAGLSCPFEQTLRNHILELCQTAHCDLQTLGQLTVKLSQHYAQAVQQLVTTHQIDKSQVRAIGCHGQTVLHHPFGQTPFSMQLVNAHVLAAETGITCITDFRGMDIALQGQGAPLVPMFHQSLFKDTDDNPKLLLNLGGIANLSIITASQLSGFDTGPSNILLDSWMQYKFGKAYDKNGQLSATGQVNKKLLALLLNDPYFSRPVPKSTGREYFNLAWFKAKLAQVNVTISDADIMATLVQLTVISIVDALNQRIDVTLNAHTLYVFGGGCQNHHLMVSLKKLLPHWQVDTTDSIAINSQYMEAMAFAWLGYRCITGQPGNSPSVTGATQQVIMGQITQVIGHKLILGE